ncbi:MAG: RIP metalloprotease RseP [Candidatus Daviesbacteria bacterium]|nr:MAG: RIP metalloprotease RseP [Candidatus Daviesbacteria bacterium]
MIITTIIFILSLVLLVVIHEFGHFLMARKFGIKVEEFGFGIPPRIIGKKIGETLVSLNWLPLGGFVRLLGEDETDSKVLKNPRSFAAHSAKERIVVVVAGVVMNLLLAWVLFYIVLIAGNFKIFHPAAEPSVYVARTIDNFPAQAAGLKNGDQVLQIDGQKITNITQAVEIIKSKDRQSVTLEIKDTAGNHKTLKLTPQKTDDGDRIIGVIFGISSLKEYKTIPEKVFSGVSYSWDLTKLTFAGLGQLLHNLAVGEFKTASQSVSGPVGLATASNNILKVGVLPYAWFLGLISLTLAIFNILPIPALDGGRLFFLMVEAFFGKKLKAETEKLIHTIGFAILIGLSLLVVFSDIGKLLP